MFDTQEQEIIRAGKQAGKSRTEVENALVRYRTGMGPKQQEAAPAAATNTTGEDLAIGAAKGLGTTLKFTQDAAATLVPFGGRVKDAMQAGMGLTEENLKADNNTQLVGKGLEIGAEFLSPFVISRLATMASKGVGLAAKAAETAGSSGFGSAIKKGIEKVSEFAKNPRLALAKSNVEPQLETSANRLFLEGSAKRLEDPVSKYEKFLKQSQGSVVDAKIEPAISNIGSNIGDQFKSVVAARRQVGKTMGEELKKVGSIKTDVLPTVDNFVTSLADEGLQYDRVAKKIIQTGKQTKMTGEDLAILEQYGKELQRLGSKPTIGELDAFMSRISNQLDIFKSSKNITGTTNAERIVKGSLRDLRSQFDPAKTGNKALEGYSKARSEYASLSDFIDEGVGYLGKITQSGDFAKDASIAKSAVQSILNNGKRDWLLKLEELTGYPAIDDSVLALQAMKDAGDFRGLSLLEELSTGGIPTSQTGAIQKIIDYAVGKAAKVVSGSPDEQTRVFLKALKEAAEQGKGL